MVRSIQAQSNSVDLSISLLDASGDPRVMQNFEPIMSLVSYSRSHPDAGQAAAIREGWEAQTADIYSWLNVDDFLYPSCLARIEQAFNDQPNTGLVYGQSMMIDGSGRFVGPHACFGPPGPSIFRTNYISQPSAFVRSDALAFVGGINPELEYTMDWDLWIRLFKAGVPFTMIEDTLSGVVLEPGTKTMHMNRVRAREIAKLVTRSCGRITAAKSLVAFWLQHRAEAGPFKALFNPLRNGLRRHFDKNVAGLGAQAGWEIVNTTTSTTRKIAFAAVGPVRWRMASSLDWRVSMPGEISDLAMKSFQTAPLHFDLENGNRPRGVHLF